MDVHPTKNVSIGIDPYPILYLWGRVSIGRNRRKALTSESMPRPWSYFSPCFASRSLCFLMPFALCSPFFSTFLSSQSLKAFPISCLGAVVTELNLELILFILVLIPLFLTSSLLCLYLFFPTLFDSLVLLYLFYPFDSVLFSFLLCLRVLFKCICPMFP